MLKMLVKTKVVQKDGTITYGEYKLCDIKFKKPKVVEEDIEEDIDDNWFFCVNSCCRHCKYKNDFIEKR